MYIIFGDHTRSFNIATKKFSVMDNVKVLAPEDILSIKVLIFIISSWKRCIPNIGYARHWGLAKNSLFNLPIIKNNEIDFKFMEDFITKLEKEQINKVDVYLKASGLKDYILTAEEQKALDDFENDKFKWDKFNLENLFGKSTRGRRLKSSDRIDGDLPFVTAGETDEGVSAFIGNDINIFSKNTITIDMFGSAKYRNYNYGGDDHISVVDTQSLEKCTSVFVTSAIHKSSYTGEFNYGRNFYPKDADVLNIQLPTKNKQPDYKTMQTLISAIKKQIIKDVVLYTNDKLSISK
jgi:hypothetical protein